MKTYIVTEIYMTCGACPSQWEGKFSDGDDLYIRYRHGYLTIQKDKDNAVEGELIFEWGSNDGSSFMNYKELKSIARNIKFPEKESKKQEGRQNG